MKNADFMESALSKIFKNVLFNCKNKAKGHRCNK